MEPSLLDYVVKKLAEAKGNWPAVAKGSRVNYFTIVRIGSGKAKSPRFETIQKIADYLKAA